MNRKAPYQPDPASGGSRKASSKAGMKLTAVLRFCHPDRNAQSDALELPLSLHCYSTLLNHLRHERRPVADCPVEIRPPAVRQPGSFSLQVFRLQTGVLRNPGQHPWPDFFIVVERKDEIGPTRTFECPMRAGLPPDAPAYAQQS